MFRKKIVILGTGGTIAGRSAHYSDNIGYKAAEIGIAELLAATPFPDESGSLIAEQVAQIDSKDMSFGVWTQLAERVNHFLAQRDVQGIVITHGTDTLEETAYFLHRVCQPSKPVVLACAMRPSTALMSDGPQNLRDALTVARHPGAKGVVTVCAGTIHGALDVQKIHTYKLDAFDSGDAGPIGCVEEGCVILSRNWPVAQLGWANYAIKNIAYQLRSPEWPQVEIIMNYAGANGAIVEALVAQGVRGLVVAATGNGTLNHALESAALKAQAEGVKVVRATRCLKGRVLPRPDDRLPDSKGLSPVKARVELILELLIAGAASGEQRL